tara:strand:+ start:2004 stop:2930 length:927 start_codon:yes stop_codon:yes gene_type:complete
MNASFLSVQVLEDPRQIYVSQSRTNVQLYVRVPAIGKKAPTDLLLHIWNKEDQERVMKTIKKDAYVFSAGSKLRHDLQSREYYLYGGSIFVIRPSEFGIINEVILSGRCIKDIDGSDPKQFRATESGYMITNQTLSVTTGKAQSDLFNFYAINKADDNYNLARLLCDFTRKGTGLTIRGRLTTDSWFDQASNQQRSTTKIQVNSMTLGPKPPTNEIKPRTTISSGSAPASLWGQVQPEHSSDPTDEAGLEPMRPEHTAPSRPSEPVAASDGTPCSVEDNQSVPIPEPWGINSALPELPELTKDDEQPF